MTWDIGSVYGNVNSFGPNSTFHGPLNLSSGAAPDGPAVGPSRAEVGVLTVINQEIQAIVAVLRQMYGYQERRLRHGPLAHEAWVADRHGPPVRVAAVQNLAPGNEQAALAYRDLVEEYNPATVLLVGVAGGIGKDVQIGDVVVADEVILHDFRHESPEGIHRRGRSQTISAELGHRLNEFFAAVPAEQPRPGDGSFRLHRGPIGAGNVVVADANSDIRRWLVDFHQKVLAVETEAAGVALSFHDSVRRDGVRGWMAIRGISDRADAAKRHQFHALAAGHAAEVMAMLLPYLYFGEPPG
jgi:adenosylhomocysteine nucleosidase